MSKIEKYIWEWENDLNFNLKIGDDFSNIKDNYLQDEFNHFNYFSKDPINFPENIQINEYGKIKLFAFGSNYSKFLFSLEKKDKSSIINSLNKILKSENSSIQHNKIQCVFRDFFLARVLIYSK